MDGAWWSAIIATLVFIGAIGTAVWHGSAKISATNAAVRANADELEDQKQDIASVRSELSAHKLKVAETYVPAEFFHQMRAEIQTGFRDLGQRIDQYMIAGKQGH